MWTANDALNQINALIDRAAEAGAFVGVSLAATQAWKGDLELCAHETISLAPEWLAAKCKPILEDLQRQDLVLVKDLGTGDPNFVNSTISDHCIKLAKLLSQIISGFIKTPPVIEQDQPPTAIEQAHAPLDRVPHDAARRLGGRMRVARKKLDLPQSVAAEICGFDVSTYKRIETGKVTAPHDRCKVDKFIQAAHTIADRISPGDVSRSSMVDECKKLMCQSPEYSVKRPLKRPPKRPNAL